MRDRIVDRFREQFGGVARRGWLAGLPRLRRCGVESDEATALGIPVGIPVLTVLFAARDERDQPLEVVESVYPADRQQFEDTYPIGSTNS